MPLARHVVSVSLVVFAVLFIAAPAVAQDVAWRKDYAAARKESAETGKPLLLDFGTEACGWCKKLDATTFRDPKVVKLLNEQFIPVKLDGNREARLTAALQVEGFPTLILASSEGKVAGRHAGYLDAPQLLAFASKAVVKPAAAPSRGEGAPRPSPNAADDTKAEIDAALAALYPKLVAALDR